MAYTIVGDAVVIAGSSESRKAAVFTGGNTDDAYTMDALAAARTAANDTTGTITAWVMPGDITSTMSIVCFNDNNVVEFLDFRIAAGKLTAACTDNTTAQWSITSPAVNVPAHKWTHVALVHDGVRPYLYVNGVRVVETLTTMTTPASWFAPLDGVDNGSIGAGRISGDGSYTEEFVGGISDVKYYSSALTPDQIMEDFKGARYAPSSLIAWYEFEDLNDTVTGSTYALTAVSDVYLTPCYNEFISRVRKAGVLIGDACGYSEFNGRMSALFINAA